MLHLPTSTLQQLLQVIMDNMVSEVFSSWFTGYSLSRSEHNMCLSSIIGLVNDAVKSILIVMQVTTNIYIYNIFKSCTFELYYYNCKRSPLCN
jgi:uncharacterized membrane protein YvlD (DUF360 family)